MANLSLAQLLELMETKDRKSDDGISSIAVGFSSDHARGSEPDLDQRRQNKVNGNFSHHNGNAEAISGPVSQGPILGHGLGSFQKIDVSCFKIDKPTLGSWYQVNGLACAGLVEEENDRQILYTRHQVVELWDNLDSFLEDRKQRAFSIFGSPGVGKSCEVWAWGFQNACNKNLDLLWVHVDKYATAVCVENRRDGVYRCEAGPSELAVILKNSQSKVVIFDGFERGMSLYEGCLIHLLPAEFPERKAMVVSSLGGGLEPKHIRMRLKRFRELEIEPWTQEEFLSACKNLRFFDSVSHCFDVDIEIDGLLPDSEKLKIVETLVKEKFFFAGASARWMFEHSIDEIQKTICSHLEKVSQFSSLMSFATGLRSAESYNHLLLKFRNVPDVFFVSQYAMDLALRRWGQGTDIKYAYSLAEKHKNPAFLGWVVQFDFFDQLKIVESLSQGQNKISVFDADKTSEEWTVNKVINFDSKAGKLNPDHWQVNNWMLPDTWNQAGYDAACLVLRRDGNLCLKIVQITKAKRHNLDLNVFASLIKSISDAIYAEICGIDVVILMPTGAVMPLLDLKGEGNLQLVEVGEGPKTWSKMREAENVVARYFKPYCKASA
eukprot:CAMPEP_0172158370 /NCGR_PEP_ID=MMETSP1050-20130122/4333_1 /TAXON_ID=233186 /ORGANISM="Cryptomonas curvata, Strain CCAP979/52" /LENGTH=605 /DNA_ID=CAMNT_0012827751 /DNA_START=132 /DNA_END=1950 /DNA_ORIENTATION=+